MLSLSLAAVVLLVPLYAQETSTEKLAAKSVLEKLNTLEKSVDQLTIAVAKDAATPGGGVIKISWELTQFSLPFTVKK